MHESYIRYSAEEKESIVLTIKRSEFYRILHERGLLERMEHDFIFAADEFHHKTKFANEMWQTDPYIRRRKER